MATFTFHSELADVQVTPTMEALGDQPWHVIVYPHMDLPILSTMVEASYPFVAALEAVDYFKEMHNLGNLSNAWTF